MRPDFKKILTERPRRNSGSGFKDVRRSHHGIIAEDDVGGREGMRRPYDSRIFRKDFSDLLGPLYRFLHAQVGRPWDDVFSEIAIHTKGGSMIQQHLLQHVFRYVERRVWIGTDGRLYDKRGEDLISGFVRKEFYVDPGGILCIVKRGKRVSYRWKDQKAPEEKKFPNGRLFRKLAGIWYEILMKEEPVYSYVCQPVPGSEYGDYIRVLSGTRKIETKWQCNTKELRMFGLKNA